MEHFFYNTDSRADLPWFGDDEAPGEPSGNDFVGYNPNPNKMLVPEVTMTRDLPWFGDDEALGKPSGNDFVGYNPNSNEMLAPEVTTSSHHQQRDSYEKGQFSRHVINERMRREKQKSSFMRLHSLLPSGTKKDRNSIITTAAKRVEELKKYKQRLEKENSEIEKMLCSEEEVEMEKAKININVEYPSSGIDSMLEVLKCLKQTGSKVGVIKSNLSPQEFSAVLGIETKAGAAEVEKAVHLTLFEVEKKFRLQPS